MSFNKYNKAFFLIVFFCAINFADQSIGQTSEEERWLDELYSVVWESPEEFYEFDIEARKVPLIGTAILSLYEKGNILAGLYLLDTFPIDDGDEAQKWLKINAINGANQLLIKLAENNLKAQVLLAVLYYDGRGGYEQDKYKAINLMRKPAENGYESAQYLMYLWLVKINPSESEMWLRRLISDMNQ